MKGPNYVFVLAIPQFYLSMKYEVDEWNNIYASASMYIKILTPIPITNAQYENWRFKVKSVLARTSVFESRGRSKVPEPS